LPVSLNYGLRVKTTKKKSLKGDGTSLYVLDAVPRYSLITVFKYDDTIRIENGVDKIRRSSNPNASLVYFSDSSEDYAGIFARTFIKQNREITLPIITTNTNITSNTTKSTITSNAPNSSKPKPTTTTNTCNTTNSTKPKPITTNTNITSNTTNTTKLKPTIPAITNTIIPTKIIITKEITTKPTNKGEKEGNGKKKGTKGERKGSKGIKWKKEREREKEKKWRRVLCV